MTDTKALPNGTEKPFGDPNTPKQGLFRAALRAPESALASGEFDGVFTANARMTGVFYAALIHFPWMIAGWILTLDLGGVFWIVFQYAFLSANLGAMLPYLFNRRFKAFGASRPGDQNALTDRTAVRLANVYFARFLRRLLFPWEWFLGRP